MYRATSPSPYRAPSPFRAPSPYQQPAQLSSPYQQTQSVPHHALPGNETVPPPGTITYTTTRTADGRTVYHPFRAVPASYQTAAGVVSGIQWVPAEATSILPVGAQPASEDFNASFARGSVNTTGKDWQRIEEKRRRREEKEAAKMMREKERFRREDDELRYAREADSVARERRKSFNAGAPAMAFPTHGAPGYTGSSYGGYPDSSAGPYGTAGSAGGYGRERKMSSGHGLADQMAGLDIEHSSGPGRPRKYSTHESAAERARKVSGNFGAGGYAGSAGSAYAPATGPYTPGQRAYPTSPYAGASPNIRPAEMPYTAGNNQYPGAYTSPQPGGYTPAAATATGTPYAYAPSAGATIEAARSRATTPLPGMMGAPSPRISDMQSFPGEQAQLAAPEGFSRPVNAACPYTPFEPIKIQNMDSFLDHIPRMPAVLTPHDVYIDDWSRFVQDLALAWAGRLPVPAMGNGSKPKRSTLSADLIELWNTSFFLSRGIEAVLYKGRERRSGSQIGLVDLSYQLFGDEDDSDVSSTSESEDGSDSGGEKYQAAGYGVYGQPGYGQGHMAEMIEAKRRRREMRAERKRKRKEKKIRRKEKAKAKTYSLVLVTVPIGGQQGSMHGGMMSGVPGSGMMAGVPGSGMVGGGMVSSVPGTVGSMHGGHAGGMMPGGIGGIGGGY